MASAERYLWHRGRYAQGFAISHKGCRCSFFKRGLAAPKQTASLATFFGHDGMRRYPLGVGGCMRAFCQAPLISALISLGWGSLLQGIAALHSRFYMGSESMLCGKTAGEASEEDHTRFGKRSARSISAMTAGIFGIWVTLVRKDEEKRSGITRF